MLSSGQLSSDKKNIWAVFARIGTENPELFYGTKSPIFRIKTVFVKFYVWFPKQQQKRFFINSFSKIVVEPAAAGFTSAAF